MHVRRALALTVLAPLLLTGCSDGDPEAEPTPKMPDSSSSTPTPTESESPEVESAEDFVRRWVDVSNEMQQTGETSAYLEISGKCRPCKQVAQQVASAFEAGGYVRTDGWTIKSIKDRSGGGKPIYDVRVNSAPTELKASKTSKPSRLPGGDLVYRFRLNDEAPWQLTQLTQVPS